MLKKALALLCLVGPLTATANVELCDLENSSGKSFEYKKIFDIKKDNAISEFHLSLINKYFSREGIAPRSFEEIKTAFTASQDISNDLFLISYTSKFSGKSYVEVVTFPGENPITVIYDAKSGEVKGYNNDGTVSVITARGEIPCYEIYP